MTLRRTIELAAFTLALLAATMAIHAWLTSRDEQMRLAATLAQQKQLLDAADSRERARQSTLDQTLAEIQNLKRTTQTPQQIVATLPNYLPLPQPITLAPGAAPTGPSQQGISPSPKGPTSSSTPVPPGLPNAPAAQIPAADLKPLYDFIQDCRACQAQLAAAKQNASDDAAKIAALTTQRDAALSAAKGGTFWRRLRRNAEWFAIGAAVATALSKR
jgi:type II secretory pathway pseudopilin PulG